MKKYLAVLSLLLIPALAFAATYTTKRNDTLAQVAQKAGMTVEQLASANPNLKLQGGQNIVYSVPAPSAVQTPSPAAPSQPAPSNEKRFTAYLTGWGYPDNDPANSDTTYNSGIEGHAGGTGTYTNPISMASGYVGEKSDYPYGTIFYVPNLKAYFKVVDTCASCHMGNGGLVWLDLWHGGQGASVNSVISCEENHTGNYLIIQNPASNYEVVPGSLYQSGSCRANFGNTVVVQ